MQFVKIPGMKSTRKQKDWSRTKKNSENPHNKIRANISKQNTWKGALEVLKKAQDEYNRPTGFGKVRKFLQKSRR